jgi:hypothetical protein
MYGCLAFLILDGYVLLGGVFLRGADVAKHAMPGCRKGDEKVGKLEKEDGRRKMGEGRWENGDGGWRMED